MAENIYDIPVKTIDGADGSLKDYAGKVLLVVNVASKCGLTPQYEGLEKLYADKRDQGLVVLGFPANDFGAQEPGSNDEIQSFCTTNFGVDFPMFSKISVTRIATQPAMLMICQESGSAMATVPTPTRPCTHKAMAMPLVPATSMALSVLRLKPNKVLSRSEA